LKGRRPYTETTVRNKEQKLHKGVTGRADRSSGTIAFHIRWAPEGGSTIGQLVISKEYEMKKLQTLSISLALLLGAGTLALGQASAAPLSGKLGARVELAPRVELIGNNDGKWWHKHGRRHRDHDHRHFHDGLWFTVPFWLGAAALTAEAYDDDDDDIDAHIAYCMDRYRSYHPPSNSFMGFDGERHPCVSPYDY
jgi:BA14K-like protein